MTTITVCWSPNEERARKTTRKLSELFPDFTFQMLPRGDDFRIEAVGNPMTPVSAKALNLDTETYMRETLLEKLANDLGL